MCREVDTDSLDSAWRASGEVLKVSGGQNAQAWGMLLLILGIATRIAFWFVAQPHETADTGTYFELAEELLRGDFTFYEGRRTIGYPVLLILAGLYPYAVWGLQMALGMMISMILFYLGLALTGSVALGFVSGMTYNLNLGLLFFEANLIPETQTTFLVVATFALLVLACARSRGGRTNLLLLLSGICAGSAVMARPQFIFLPGILSVLIGHQLLIRQKLNWRSVWPKMCLVGGPGMFMIIATASFNYVQFRQFTLSTQTGVGLMEHAIAFVELAPDRHSRLRDVLAKHRDAHLAKTGRHTATWNAVPELKQVTGFSSLVQLDRELLVLSKELILLYPKRYLALVADAWLSFWAVPNPKGIDSLRPLKVSEWLTRVWHVEQPLLRAFNAIFLILAAAASISKRFRERTHWGFFCTTMSVTVIASSLLQAFVIGVDNARYGVTTQPLIALLVITVVHKLWNLETVRNEHARLVHVEPSKGEGK